jgi:hypothetical protein
MWQPIETAPRDGVILLYGEIRPHPADKQLFIAGQKVRAAGYWDFVDEAWSPTTSPWTGPWLEPTHWHPIPDAPA